MNKKSPVNTVNLFCFTKAKGCLISRRKQMKGRVNITSKLTGLIRQIIPDTIKSNTNFCALRSVKKSAVIDNKAAIEKKEYTCDMLGSIQV